MHGKEIVKFLRFVSEAIAPSSATYQFKLNTIHEHEFSVEITTPAPLCTIQDILVNYTDHKTNICNVIHD